MLCVKPTAKLEDLTLVGCTITDTDQLKRLGETFGDTDDHVVDEGTIEAVQ